MKLWSQQKNTAISSDDKKVTCKIDNFYALLAF